jgi:ketosteroid isomerase-like protein
MRDDTRSEHRLRRELEQLSAAWDLAMISNDADAIGRFMADDWVIVSASGVTTRDDFLAVVASGALTHQTFRGDIISVRPYGDAAVVTGRVRNNGHYNGEAFSADEWTTDVFARHNDSWRCVHSHITPVRET